MRENSEGEYAGVGGRAHRGQPIEVGMDVAVSTRAGIERIARFACSLAMSRPRKLLTGVTKSNAQRLKRAQKSGGRAAKHADDSREEAPRLRGREDFESDGLMR